MKETATDNKVYGRALDHAAEITTSPADDETFSRYKRRVGLDAIMAFEDEIDRLRSVEDTRLRDALGAARDKFAFYATQHHAKGTEDSTKKAIVNEQMVALISLALGDR